MLINEVNKITGLTKKAIEYYTLQGLISLIEATEYMGTEEINAMNDNLKRVTEDPDGYLSENKEILDQYLKYRQSCEYRNSPAYRIMELTKGFFSLSGYNDIFIPAMKELSSSYAEYHKRLEEANEKLLAQYPDMG